MRVALPLLAPILAAGRWVRAPGSGAACLTALALAGCSEGAEPRGFEDLFVPVATIQLEESPSDPIVAIHSLGRRPGGGFILADRHADRVRLFDEEGRVERVLGGSGEGPGELNGPMGAVELSDGRVAVVQRSDPRLTVFRADSGVQLGRLPGAYGYWAAEAGGRVVAGVATGTDRLAVLSLDGEGHRTFGGRDPRIRDTPFWAFFAREHAAVLGERIAVVTSFFPVVRMHGLEGDSLGKFGEPPPSWVEPTDPPVDQISDPGDRRQIEEWAGSFTVVSAMKAVGRERLVVQYARHVPEETDPYAVRPRTVDVYDVSGAKIAEDLVLTHPIVGGGDELMVLTAEPPEPWTVTLYRWRGRR